MTAPNASRESHENVHPPASPAPGKLIVFALLAAAVVAGGIGFGILPRLKAHAALDVAASDRSGPKVVRVAPVSAGAPNADITLPGTTLPFRSTTLFAKSNGFLRRNRAEVGDHVKAGAVLAEIDAPETDQDILLARARLDESLANVTIVKQTAERNRGLAAQGVVSQQTADDTRALANSAQATVKAREADLMRLRALRGYQDVVAPFDGVVTKRNIDPGALVGPAGAGSVAIFEVAQVEPLRIFLDVPQSLAAGIVAGLDAKVSLPSAGKSANGKVVRTSTVLDQAMRTLKTEVQLPESGSILPGAFVYVKISVPRTDPPMLITANSLIVRKEGTLVARVEGNHVKLVNVTIVRDLGKDLEITGAVKPGEPLVVNPTDDLVETTTISVAEEKRDAG